MPEVYPGAEKNGPQWHFLLTGVSEIRAGERIWQFEEVESPKAEEDALRAVEGSANWLSD